MCVTSPPSFHESHIFIMHEKNCCNSFILDHFVVGEMNLYRLFNAQEKGPLPTKR